MDAGGDDILDVGIGEAYVQLEVLVDIGQIVRELVIERKEEVNVEVMLTAHKLYHLVTPLTPCLRNELFYFLESPLHLLVTPFPVLSVGSTFLIACVASRVRPKGLYFVLFGQFSWNG